MSNAVEKRRPSVPAIAQLENRGQSSSSPPEVKETLYFRGIGNTPYLPCFGIRIVGILGVVIILIVVLFDVVVFVEVVVETVIIEKEANHTDA